MSKDENPNEAAYRLRVGLAILGSNYDYLDINIALGMTAKHFARKGQSVEGRPIAKQNVWSIWGDAPAEDGDFDAHWLPIAALIANKRDQLIAIGRQSKIEIAIVVHAFSDFPGLDLSKETIHAINSIGASLDIDLSGSLTGETY
jgi:Domain of unknown function (DUF4279)